MPNISKKIAVIFSFFVSFLFVFSIKSQAFYTNMPASLVIGQEDFKNNTSNMGRGNSPTAANALFDVSASFVYDGKLIVTDRSNHRILIFNKFPTGNTPTADVVIGQADFTSNSANQGITRAANTMNTPHNAIVAEGKLIVAEQSNNRVLIFNQVPTSNNAFADVVLGQTDFSTATSNQGGRNANTLFTPLGVSYYNGKLFVADSSNNRILIYNSIPTSNKQSADVVIGQSSFTVGTANAGGSLGAFGYSVPYQAIVAEGKLLVVDASNNRILIYNSIPTAGANNIAADVVIGQADFTHNSANQGNGTTVASPNTLSGPRGIMYDSGKLYIVDANNSRVLIYNHIPTTNNASADVAIGAASLSASFSGTSCNQGGNVGAAAANKLCLPAMTLFKYNNKLIVPDASNRRMLIFEDYSSTPTLGFGGFDVLPENNLRVKGNVIQGERGKFAIQSINVSLNGQGEKLATSISSGADEGTDKTKYEFYHDFSPWEGSGVDKDKWTENLVGYTLKIRAVNYNADETNMFLFKPFTLDSFTSSAGISKISFHVGDKYIDRIKDNIDHFEVWVRELKIPGTKTTSSIYSDWKKYIENIPTSSIDTKGVINYQTPNTLTNKEWEIRVKAISKSSGFAYESNTVSASNSSEISKNNPEQGSISKTWFPLQIDNISGIKATPIASTNLSIATTKYKTKTNIPTITGTAFSGATVKITVTDVLTGKKAIYNTTAKNSSFSISVILFPISVIDASVRDSSGRFNRVPSFEVRL